MTMKSFSHDSSFGIDFGWTNNDGFHILPSLCVTGRELIFEWLFAYVDIYRRAE